eukprot:748880-Hanusia_phi.AAC.3
MQLSVCERVCSLNRDENGERLECKTRGRVPHFQTRRSQRWECDKADRKHRRTRNIKKKVN